MAITIKKIQDVQVEIDRLQKAFSDLEAVRLEERERLVAQQVKYPERRIYVEEDGLPTLSTFPAQTGAIRRASMDLTRTLARLRNLKD